MQPWDWRRLDYLDVPPFVHRGLGLTNQIHPLFLQRIPEVGQPYNNAYLVDIAGRALQLASLIITSPGSLKALFNILYGPRLRVPNMHFEGQACYETTPNPIPGATQKERDDFRRFILAVTGRALKRLASTLTMSIRDGNTPGPRLGDDYALTVIGLGLFREGINITDEVPVYGDAFPDLIVGDDVPNTMPGMGVASTIYINKGFLTKLEELRNRPGDNTSQILALETKMAMTLCHEVAHACNNAVDNPTLISARLEMVRRSEGLRPCVIGTNEPFGLGQDVAELGWYWEQEVFKGSFSYKPSESSRPLQIAKWPNFLNGNRDGIDLIDFPTRRGRGQKHTAINCFVPMQYIRNLHRPAFWNRVQTLDFTALYVHMMIGLREVNPTFFGLDTQWRAEDSDEGKYPEDKNERLMTWGDQHRVSRYKLKGSVGFGPDPSAAFANRR